MKKLIRALPLALVFFAVAACSQVFGQQVPLKQWLGSARPQKIGFFGNCREGPQYLVPSICESFVAA